MQWLKMAKRNQYAVEGHEEEPQVKQTNFRLTSELYHKQLEGQLEKFLNLSYSTYVDFPNAYDQHICVTMLGVEMERGLLAEELEMMMH